MCGILSESNFNGGPSNLEMRWLCAEEGLARRVKSVVRWWGRGALQKVTSVHGLWPESGILANEVSRVL